MWTMAPADMPILAPSGSKFKTSYHPSREIHNGESSTPAYSSISAPASSSTVLSSTPTSSLISGGNAACYDGVREMLCSQPRWASDKEEVLLQPYNYLASRPGKEIRSQMVNAFNVWLKVPEDKLKIIHKVIGMLHTSSLLVDDVEDDSTLRRGAPVAHVVYGVPQTINTANYVYFLVFAEVFAMSRGEAGQQRGVEEMIVDEMVNLHRGQGMDLYWRDNLVCPTEAEYIEMVNNKTSGLLRIVIKLMVANSPIMKQNGQTKTDVLIPLVNLIGLLFQIRDDYMNLQSGDYAENKGYCEDLTEGKFSFPIIHSIRSSECHPPEVQQIAREGLRRNSGGQATHLHGSARIANGEAAIIDQQHLLSILQGRPKDARTKRLVVEYMEKQTDSFKYSREVMGHLHKLIQGEVDDLEAKIGGGSQNVRLRGILGALCKGWSE